LQRASAMKYEPLEAAPGRRIPYVQIPEVVFDIRSAEPVDARGTLCRLVDSSRAVIVVIDGSAATVANTSATVVCGSQISVGNLPFGWFLPDESVPMVVTKTYQRPAGLPKVEPPIPNPLLEMHSTRRSLRDKAREEISDFERDYPW
jgi:hypothetical protein